MSMTNTEMLERKIEEKGITVEELSAAVGLLPCDLLRKMSGKEEFLVSEIWSVGRTIGLDKNELEEIFLKSL